MLTQVQESLRQHIHRDDRAAFYEQWSREVRPQASGSATVDLCRADEQAGADPDELNRRLLDVVSSLQADDLKPPPKADPLLSLMQSKLSHLERARLLATDAAMQFQLDEQIRELRTQIAAR